MPADAATCAKEPLRTGRSALLPDCRAYELVTPEKVDAAGGDLEFSGDLAKAVPSADGEHLALHAQTVYLQPGAHHEGTDAVLSRTPSGWTVNSLTAPGMEGESFIPEVLSPDFSTTAFLSTNGLEEAAPKALDFGPVGGPYQTIATVPTPTKKEEAEGVHPVSMQLLGANSGSGGVPAFSTVVFASTDTQLLPPGAERQAAEESGPETNVLYEWSRGGLRLVNVGNDGKLVSPCPQSTSVFLGYGYYLGDAVNAVSADGSRVVFGDPDSESAPEGCLPPAVFMRVDGRETRDLSEPEEGVVIAPGERGAARFVGASPDDSRVYFESSSALTPGAGEAPYLYEYMTEAAPEHRLKLIANHVTGRVLFGNQFDNPYVVVSGDGTVVYYEAIGTVEAGGHPVSVNGVWRYDTRTEATSFVAEPAPLNTTNQPRWYTTRDGRFLLFTAGSRGLASGVRVLGPHGLETEARGVAHQELYRYDAVDGSVTCVSCGEGAAAPARGFAEPPSNISSILPLAGVTGAPVEVSEDGARVFFESSAQLAAGDTNGPPTSEEDAELEGGDGRAPAADVYEWEAPGTEDGPGVFCHAVHGCTFLISAGEAVGPEQFLGASEDGRDVFLSSAASLVPGAPSGFTSVYDARIGGGFAQKAGAVECTSCQGVGNPQPSFGTPSSASFVGAGNPPSPAPSAGAPKSKPKPKPKPRCRRGHRRSRRGRCVRVKAKR
ncbi:MAG TPA: hypothetical protein VNY27_02050 [Solirubrobacteraceae bacterium]|jgi:hypothetical protein|nr:hypothetical protein [Solirubrobacteraceae bacterium]